MINFIIEHKIDGVFSCFSEEIIPHSINYLHKLKINCYATSQQWNILMNKRNMIDACLKYGIEQIPEYDDYDINNITFPVIVKPTTNCG